jgi:hypothetical protein
LLFTGNSLYWKATRSLLYVFALRGIEVAVYSNGVVLCSILGVDSTFLRIPCRNLHGLSIHFLKPRFFSSFCSLLSSHITVTLGKRPFHCAVGIKLQVALSMCWCFQYIFVFWVNGDGSMYIGKANFKG